MGKYWKRHKDHWANGGRGRCPLPHGWLVGLLAINTIRGDVPPQSGLRYTVPYCTVQYNIAPHPTTPYRTVRYKTIPAVSLSLSFAALLPLSQSAPTRSPHSMYLPLSLSRSPTLSFHSVYLYGSHALVSGIARPVKNHLLSLSLCRRQFPTVAVPLEVIASPSICPPRSPS